MRKHKYSGGIGQSRSGQIADVPTWKEKILVLGLLLIPAKHSAVLIVLAVIMAIGVPAAVVILSLTIVSLAMSQTAIRAPDSLIKLK